jgi:uncharacterized membrane protein YfcA
MIILGFGLAFVIGLSLGLLGGGGSILSVPVLAYVLHYDMKQAVPMSLVVVGVTSVIGVIGHHRNRTVRWDAAIPFGPAAVAGAFAGGRLATRVSSQVQLTVFAVLMLAAAASMYLGPSLWAARDPAAGGTGRRSLVAIMALGAAVGLLTGLVGVGGGFLYVPALVLLAGIGLKDAVGTALVLITMSCAAGLASHLGSVTIDWAPTALFTALAIVGVLAGTRLVRSISQTTLRHGFAILLGVMGIVVLLETR